MNEYRLAFVLDNGGWDIVTKFRAEDHAAANVRAAEITAEDYPGRGNDWWVLTKLPDGRTWNINGGEDQE